MVGVAFQPSTGINFSDQLQKPVAFLQSQHIVSFVLVLPRLEHITEQYFDFLKERNTFPQFSQIKVFSFLLLIENTSYAKGKSSSISSGIKSSLDVSSPNVFAVFVAGLFASLLPSANSTELTSTSVILRVCPSFS